jgi:hypothetical protein
VLTNILYSDATRMVTNDYNRLGQLASQVPADYQMNSVYGLAGQLLSESFVGGPLNGLSVSGGYDNYLRRTSLAVGGATTPWTITYGYDAASRLKT